MTWTIDPAHTIVGFKAKHMGLSTVRGRFTRFRGEIDLDPDDLTATKGRVEVELGSVDTGNEDRDEHLRSGDFFDVRRHPTMVFEPGSIERIDDGRYVVRGDLTIKGVTRPVEFEYEHAGEAIDPYGTRKLGGRLTGRINRRDWGLTWNVALEAGGWLVGDTIEIEIDGQVAESEAARADRGRRVS